MRTVGSFARSFVRSEPLVQTGEPRFTVTYSEFKMGTSKVIAAARPIGVEATAPQILFATRAHLWLNRMLLGGIAIQFYTVALSTLGIAGFAAHALLGWSMIAVALLSVLAACLKRMPLASLVIPVLALALTVAQPVLASIPVTVFPVIYALHGANAVLLLLLALRVEKNARTQARQLAEV